MSYYLLPRTALFMHKYIDCIEKEDQPIPIISNSLSDYLYDIKKKLEKREKDWDIFKKYTNPYEYIHSIVPYRKKSVSSHKPLSRSYFKMIEIMNIFNLQFTSKPMRTFHLAEGPGGFIEAISEMRKCPQDLYIGMTIMDDKNDPNIPAWKKSESFLKQNKNVFIECGADKTGNIMSIDNFTYCKEKYGSSMDLITADGGFDFSLDFNNQEIQISKLLFAQICFALVMQAKGGVFILKIFDCFMQQSVDLLYILASFYEKVYITKPYTSRYANSEKYIVCKGFLFGENRITKNDPKEVGEQKCSDNCSFFPFLHRAFEKMSTPGSSDVFVHRFLNFPLSYLFLTKIEEYNAIFGQQQIENIHYTISLIENKHKQEKIDSLIKTNLQKCIQWCSKYSVPMNQLPTTSTNIFLERSVFSQVADEGELHVAKEFGASR